jgi:ATP-binding cassette subfamily F protein uup
MVTLKSRLGKKIIELSGVSKAFDGHNVIKDFSYTVQRDDRIGIVGRNGAGKSTLLNIVAGRLTPDHGAVDTGTTVSIGYFSQESRELDLNQRVYDFISEVAGEITTPEGTFSASLMLERFLFTSDLQYTTIGRLSGGERRRLFLLSILMTAPNILLLDEPTNDLDIETLTILEDYLETFPGAVIAVSHDRYFLDKIATSILEVCEGGETRFYSGNYSAYSEKREPQKLITVKKEAQPKNNIITRQQKLKFTFKEQHEYDSIDSDIAAIEAQIAACDTEINGSAGSDYIRLQELMAQKEKLNADLEVKTERWLYLNELAEKIAAQNS